jgi:hypothetical protein
MGTSTGRWVNRQVISSCPKCGAPIWGEEYWRHSSESPPPHIYSCSCRLEMSKDREFWIRLADSEEKNKGRAPEERELPDD